ncbi:BlaI/MecI/CopY family transcriptional regulator [Clostridium kluyveri]|uniref:Transcriptional regulator n=1 Tax=Clostridium kluyveri TaxID=1534 RepID=A0A1L5F9U4_CLOKL|nr:BlaI/MecI/CopY family transcriptional regulator [Clostridium kluyveri]APM39762.1 transcriptional regulator [Clostridium kluyveri]UZQ50079.1 BlaI/MecI/CopY family transcriptional regulator [Clostridium kluyveri]
MKKLPKTELEIMKFIWSRKDTVSTKEVAKHMEDVLSWKLSTTSKTLSRLVKKEFLAAERIGKQCYYTSIVEENDYLKFETKDFFNYLHGKSLKSIISTLEESDEITNEDLDELENWIKNR